MLNQQALIEIIDRFSEAQVLVVGDLILDRYVWGTVNRISPEAPVPVVQVKRDSAAPGGAANVVSNIHALGGKAIPVGLVGNDIAGRQLQEKLAQDGISLEGITEGDQYSTIVKTRIIAHHQQVVRVDRDGVHHLTDADRHGLHVRLSHLSQRVAALIISDYGKGIVDQSLMQLIMQENMIPLVCVDPKERNFQHYRGVTILTPNQKEAESLSGVQITDRPSLQEAARVIFNSLRCEQLLITRGEHGMALFPHADKLIEIPTRAKEVYDVSGAGDTVIGTFTLARVAGASPHQAAQLANLAAGIVVGKLGTARVSAEELKAAIIDA